jgi:hypothetical protein
MNEDAPIQPTVAPTGAPRRRGRKKRPAIIRENLVAPAHLHALQQHLERLRAAGGDHPNRLLHLDNLLVALLLAFYNPTCRSLRTIEGLGKVCAEEIGLDRLCRSTTADALAVFDAQLLLPVLKDLRGRLPALKRANPDLEKILRQVIAADGSYFAIYANVAWALHRTRCAGNPDAQIRLNLQLDVRDFTPVRASVSGDDGCAEPDAFIPDLVPDAIYVSDRNFVNFAFFEAVRACGSDFVIRAKATAPAFSPSEERLLTPDDRAAGVLSDRVGFLTGRKAPEGLVREVVIADPETGKSIRLMTSLMDLPASLIGTLYRHRWQIELFFRWLKVWGRFEHLLSHSRNGLTIQFYVAVIGVLLMYLSTGHRVSKYAVSLLGFVASGQATLEDILPILAQREHERDLERARLARKRAKKLGL